MSHPDVNTGFCSNFQGCSRKFLLENLAIRNSLQGKRMLWVAQASVWGLQGAPAIVWELWRAAELASVFLQNINQLAFHSFNSTSLTNGYTQWFHHFPKMCPHCLLKRFTQFCPSTADFGSLLCISTSSCVQKFCLTCFLAMAFPNSHVWLPLLEAAFLLLSCTPFSQALI